MGLGSACEETARNRQQKLLCDSCFGFTHRTCGVKLTHDDYRKYQRDPNYILIFTCIKCCRTSGIEYLGIVRVLQNVSIETGWLTYMGWCYFSFSFKWYRINFQDFISFCRKMNILTLTLCLKIVFRKVGRKIPMLKSIIVWVL